MAERSLIRTLRALVRPRPSLRAISGDALVFAGAPEPVVPEGLLGQAVVITCNASQVALDALGVVEPDITLMRSNMGDDNPTSALKIAALAGRRTGHLMLFSEREDPNCRVQLELLEGTRFEYGTLQIIDRTDATTLYNDILRPGMLRIARKYQPSMGVRAALIALAAGADRVALAGVSFRSRGCSYLELDYPRKHAEADQEVLELIRRQRLPVYPTDQALAEDTGLALWPGAGSSCLSPGDKTEASAGPMASDPSSV